VSARLVIVFVVDGLRPDAITAADSPTLHRLRAEGVWYANSHAVFPTVTRVNAATLATGGQPGTHGIVGNQIYVPAVDAERAIDTSAYRRLLEVDRATGGELVLTKTLAERLEARGMRLAAVSSGSTGSALLTNPRGPAGVGVLVNGYFDPGQRVAWPDEASAAILARFGAAPPKGRGGERYDAAVTWTQRVLREYVLPEITPAVVINWLTEPDHTQHSVGVGSPAAREALRHADREIAQVLDALDGLGLGTSTDVLVGTTQMTMQNLKVLGIGLSGNAGVESSQHHGSIVHVVLTARDTGGSRWQVGAADLEPPVRRAETVPDLSEPVGGSSAASDGEPSA
jgi:hypothetical protein